VPDRPSGGVTWYNIMVTLGVLITAGGGGWTLLQSQLASIDRQIDTTTRSFSKRLDELQREEERIRNESIHRNESNEFTKRMDHEVSTINERIKIIEATRPTVGELQAIGTSTTRELLEIKERIKSLEENLRKLAIVTVPAK